jgi:membrane protein DedA with SNARE-associated domain
MRYNWRPMESFLTSAGYGALILFGFLEACCIPISSEITFGFAGVLAFQGHLNLILVIIIGSLAELAGSFASFSVGRWGGRPLVDRLGKYVLITRTDVDRAERFLAGKGAWAVPVGRMIPVIRAFISIVAGLIEMPPLRFTVLSLIGTVVYVSAFSVIGYAVGSAWENVAHDVSVIGYVVVALVVVAIVAFVAIRLRAVRREGREAREGQLREGQPREGQPREGQLGAGPEGEPGSAPVPPVSRRAERGSHRADRGDRTYSDRSYRG